MANLHANQNGRPSLLDLMENSDFRIVDTVVARLVNLVQVKPGDFIVTADQGVKMQPATIALLVRNCRRDECMLPMHGWAEVSSGSDYPPGIPLP